MATLPPPLPSAINGFGASVNSAETDANKNENGAASPQENNPDEPVGIIYPPPEIRKVADKTAAFVATSGSGAQLEERLRQSEINNPKFCFLNPTDPYHAYYAMKIKETKEGTTPQAVEVQAEVEAAMEEVEFKPPEEPPALDFIASMPPVSAQDLDIIKLTAQFVARNGRQFMTSLAQRESRNFQFDFLKPNHSLFTFFSTLVDQYTKVLVPSNTMMEQVEMRAKDKYAVQDMVMRRVEYTAYQQELKKKRDEKEDAERAAFLSIDWQDFVVVETIEFTDADDAQELPGPKSLSELESMSLAQKRMARNLAALQEAGDDDMPQDIEIDNDDMVDSDEEVESPPPQPAPAAAPAVSTRMEEDEVTPALPPSTDGAMMAAPKLSGPMKIRENFVPKAFVGRTGAALQEITQICQICGQSIPVSEMEEHVKADLADPRFREERRALEARQQAANVLLDGAMVARNLQQFQAHRANEEKTAEEERKKQIEREKNAWDGASDSVSAATQRSVAAAAANYTPEAPVDPSKLVGPRFGGAPPVPSFGATSSSGSAPQPQLYRQPGTYNQTFSIVNPVPPPSSSTATSTASSSSASTTAPVPTSTGSAAPASSGVVPPPVLLPGMLPPPPGMPHLPPPPFAGAFPPPPPGGFFGLPVRSPAEAAAHLPPQPPLPPSSSAPQPPLPPSLPSRPTIPAQVPPPGRHAGEDFGGPDRDSKRFKSEHHHRPHHQHQPHHHNQHHHNQQQDQAGGQSWITLEIMMPEAGASDMRPEWNRDGLASVVLENLVAGTLISTVKDKILGLTGFPAGKQKLMTPTGTVTKNQATLAEYGLRLGQRAEMRLAVKK
ncbi:SF3a splicing factor complex subunit [Actinomortierella ambigua]|uniref:SF3a splicing factor complex subunit n=1 Tax=Actinomortierella ambigua TaxID=1343610 RepID=A0A9P6Q8Q5_9FUNG|nr:SF3a splicing factor complex subunit [Actinomortierella ambigua]